MNNLNAQPIGHYGNAGTGLSPRCYAALQTGKYTVMVATLQYKPDASKLFRQRNGLLVALQAFHTLANASNIENCQTKFVQSQRAAVLWLAKTHQ